MDTKTKPQGAEAELVWGGKTAEDAKMADDSQNNESKVCITLPHCT